MSAPAPRLSLGLPVYNGENFLAESLDALLAQTYTDFELIVSDNGSTDRTGEIAQRYAAQDPRVRYVHHPVNRGSTFNHNVTIELARGELFKWVSHDDLYHPELLQRCVEAVDARPEIALAHAWTAFIDENGEVTHKIDYPLTTDVPDPVERFRSILYTHGGDDIYGVIPMSVLRQVKPFGSYHWADRTYVAELALQGPFHNVPEFLYFRRDHPTRTTRVGNRDIRVRCSRLDPARANRWRCRRVLVLWILGHANPMYRLQFLSSPDLALREVGRSSRAARVAERVTSVLGRSTTAGRQEGKTS